MKNGVPWQVALDLPEDELAAYSIIFDEFDGNVMDWEAGQWVPRNG